MRPTRETTRLSTRNSKVHQRESSTGLSWSSTIDRRELTEMEMVKMHLTRMER